MRVYWNLATNGITQGQGFLDDLETLRMTRGLAAKFDVYFRDAGNQASMPSTTQAMVSVKSVYSEGNLITYSGAFSSNVFSGHINFITEHLNELFGIGETEEKPFLDLLMNVAYRRTTADAWVNSQLISLRLENNIHRSGEPEPEPPGPTPADELVYFSSVEDVEEIATIGKTNLMVWLDDGTTVEQYLLKTDTDQPTTAGLYIRPDDYNSVSNVKTWVKRS